MGFSEAIQQLNQLLVKEGLMQRQPRYHYYQAKKPNGKPDCYRFGWTTERTSDKKFHAFVYRVYADGRMHLARDVHQSRRRIAKAKAHKWYKRRVAELVKYYTTEAEANA
jgi:hypothetical protein